MKTILFTFCLGALIGLNSKSQSIATGKEILQRTQLRQIYTAELGVKEKSGNNDGVRVEEYLRYVGLKKGDPWCAAFVCWAFGRAGVDNPRTGWSPALFPKNRLVWERSETTSLQVRMPGRAAAPLPQMGDVFGIWFPDKGRIAHAGFVDSWSDKWLITVEGNTNETGSREGDGVWRKRRLVRTLWGVAGWVAN